MEPIIGEIRLFSGNFAPKNWAFCDGQILPIAQNEVLFLVLGSAYGGDGRTTFALPDLRGRVPMHAGSGPGLSKRKIGQKSGTETNSLTISQLPSHDHPTKIGENLSLPINVEIPRAAAGESDVGYHAAHDNNPFSYSHEHETKVKTNKKERMVVIGNAGHSFPINNMQPYTVVNYIIALNGSNPERW